MLSVRSCSRFSDEGGSLQESHVSNPPLSLLGTFCAAVVWESEGNANQMLARSKGVVLRATIINLAVQFNNFAVKIK